MKHKLLFVLEGTKVFMFQSGFLRDSIHSECRVFIHNSTGLSVSSANCPEFDYPIMYVNGSSKKLSFTIAAENVTPDQYDKLKELENAYNNR